MYNGLHRAGGQREQYAGGSKSQSNSSPLSPFRDVKTLREMHEMSKLLSEKHKPYLSTG